jgi:N-formylglutamate amidohydrolase
MTEMASSASPEDGLLAEDRDAALRALIAHPLTLTAPARWMAPFVFSSPHSGTAYTPGFVASTRLDPLALRRSEDAFVDELFAAAPLNGAYLLTARFPRAYVDVNRADSEIDPAMFEGSAAARAPASARVAAGLGVIPKVVRDGVEIYGKRLPAGEAAFRLDAFYRPYHAALERLLAQGKAAFGHAILIDCHSMPPVAKGHDIVIGDRHGSACAPSLSARIESLLWAEGFSVGRNHPYAGGFTTSHYGRPSEGVHAVQIEINRGLYLDEKKIQKATGFAACQESLSRFIGRLVSTPYLSA